MKKAAIVICCVLIGLTAILAAQTVYVYVNNRESGERDKTDNVNVMLNRADNWLPIVASPLFDEQQMNLVDGSTATIPITAELLRQFWGYTDEQVNSTNIVYHSTTHDAYMNLIDSQPRYYGDEQPVSLIFVTSPSDEEQSYALRQGVTLDIQPIAKDGFVFITHKDNPVDSLTVEQIQGIYSGTITNWKQLGGEDRAIQAFQREKNSGSQTAMEQLVMQGKTMADPPEARVYEGMGMLVDAVAEYTNGPASIGYTYYYYINNLYKNENIKVLKVNGVSPENANLLNNTYPFTTAYYAVMRSTEEANSPARRLRDFLLTEKGQQVIEMAGYCRGMVKTE